MATYTDNFTDTSATLLESHAPTSGAAWIKHTADSTGSLAISNANRCRAGTVSVDCTYYKNDRLMSPDYDVQADFVVLSTNGGHFGLLLRTSSGANTKYLCGCINGNSWRIYKYVNGAATSLTNTAVTLSTTTYTIKATVRGSTITLYVNSTQVGQITDASISSIGFAGILLYNQPVDDANGVHVDNFAATDQGAAVAVTDTNLYLSPYNWYSDGAGSMTSNNIKGSSTFARCSVPGAYFKSAFTGTSFTLLVDTSPLVSASISSGAYPYLAWTVDGGAMQSYQLTSADSTLALAAGLSSGNHNVVFWLKGADGSVSRWYAPQCNLKITGAALDNGAATITPFGLAAIRTKIAILYWDSIGEGRQDGSSTSSPADSTITFVQLMAAALNAEIGTICAGGQGYTTYGAGNTPPLPLAWDKYDNNNSRLVNALFTPSPDYLFCGHGTNDTALSSATVTTQFANFRTAAPNAKLFLCVPFKQGASAAVIRAATLPDSNSFLVDLGAAGSIGVSGGGIATLYSNDGTHPNPTYGHPRLAAMLTDAVQAFITASTVNGVIVAGYVSGQDPFTLMQAGVVDGTITYAKMNQLALALPSAKTTLTDNGDGSYTITFKRQDGTTALADITYNKTNGVRTAIVIH